MPMNIYFIRKRNGSRKELGRHPFTFDEAPSTWYCPKKCVSFSVLPPFC